MKKVIASLVVILPLMFWEGAVFGEEAVMKKITITSPVFQEGERIPFDHTCDGANVSPPLQWTGIPQGAKSLALIVDDPDAPAGDWVHWVFYDLPPDTSELPYAVPDVEKIPSGGTQGKTDSGSVGYEGPCPPRGMHRYFFKIYALDAMLSLKPGVTKKELLKAMQGHVLAEGVLMGTYQRS